MRVCIVLGDRDQSRGNVIRRELPASATVLFLKKSIAQGGVLASGLLAPFDLVIHHCGSKNREYCRGVRAYQKWCSKQRHPNPCFALFSGGEIDDARREFADDPSVVVCSQTELLAGLAEFATAFCQWLPRRIGHPPFDAMSGSVEQMALCATLVRPFTPLGTRLEGYLAIHGAKARQGTGEDMDWGAYREQIGPKGGAGSSRQQCEKAFRGRLFRPFDPDRGDFGRFLARDGEAIQEVGELFMYPPGDPEDKESYWFDECLPNVAPEAFDDSDGPDVRPFSDEADRALRHVLAVGTEHYSNAAGGLRRLSSASRGSLRLVWELIRWGGELPRRSGDDPGGIVHSWSEKTKGLTEEEKIQAFIALFERAHCEYKVACLRIREYLLNDVAKRIESDRNNVSHNGLSTLKFQLLGGMTDPEDCESWCKVLLSAMAGVAADRRCVQVGFDLWPELARNIRSLFDDAPSRHGLVTSELFAQAKAEATGGRHSLVNVIDRFIAEFPALSKRGAHETKEGPKRVSEMWDAFDRLAKRITDMALRNNFRSYFLDFDPTRIQ